MCSAGQGNEGGSPVQTPMWRPSQQVGLGGGGGVSSGHVLQPLPATLSEALDSLGRADGGPDGGFGAGSGEAALVACLPPLGARSAATGAATSALAALPTPVAASSSWAALVG